MAKIREGQACKVVAEFHEPDGTPKAGVEVIVRVKPAGLWRGVALTGEHRKKTDERGRVAFMLAPTAELESVDGQPPRYLVTVNELRFINQPIDVPQAPAANLFELLRGA